MEKTPHNPPENTTLLLLFFLICNNMVFHFRIMWGCVQGHPQAPRGCWVCLAEGQIWHPLTNGPDATCSDWLQVNSLEDEFINRKILQDIGHLIPP